MQKHFKPILKRANLPENLRLYDLRHICATLLLSANENPKVVSERLGHASITLTMDVYSHVLPDMQQAASDKLESLLFNKTGTLANLSLSKSVWPCYRAPVLSRLLITITLRSVSQKKVEIYGKAGSVNKDLELLFVSKRRGSVKKDVFGIEEY